VFCNSSHSAVKSGNTCDLITFRFSYMIYRGTTQFPIRRHVLLLKGYSIYWIVLLH
jgi:hypothetical protein